MKIERPIGTTFNTALTNTAASARKQIESDNVPKTAATQVQLSGEMQALEGQMTQKSSSTFDAKKVQEIRTALAEGRFQVNADNVADGLLATVKDLIQSNTKNG